MVQILPSNTFTTAKWIVSSVLSDGTHTTIAGALTSASSGDTIFIRPGTYTEDLTLKAGVNLTAYQSDSSLTASTGNVTIVGKATMTTAGTVNISGIQLQTNSDFVLAVTGSANSIVCLNNCYLNMINNTGISYTTSGATSNIILDYCRGNLGTTGIKIFAHTGASNINFSWCTFSNSGASTTASTCASGGVSMINTFIGSPITFSGTGVMTAMKYSEIDTSATNTTCLTTVTGTNVLSFVRLSSGSATPLSVGGTALTDALLLSHSNATAVSGAGTLVYNSIFQDTTVGALTTTTLTGKGNVGMQNSTAPAAGYIGERITANVVSGSAVSLTSTTPTTITSISLTPGIWDVSALGCFTGATTATKCVTAIGTTTNSLTGTVAGTSRADLAVTGFSNSDSDLVVPPFRVSLSATTTYYLIAQLNWTVGAGAGYGSISATRVA